MQILKKESGSYLIRHKTDTDMRIIVKATLNQITSIPQTL